MWRKPLIWISALFLLAGLMGGPCLAQSPYVQPILPESGTLGGLAVVIEKATEYDIFSSSGYEKSRILGKKVYIRGTVTNHTGRKVRGVSVVFNARDIFGKVLSSCQACPGCEVIGAGQTEPFECSVEAKVASDLNRITYSVTALGDGKGAPSPLMNQPAGR